jgi:hypothetical protein
MSRALKCGQTNGRTDGHREQALVFVYVNASNERRKFIVSLQIKITEHKSSYPVMALKGLGILKGDSHHTVRKEIHITL